MDKYELFLKELSELCRKHDIQIGTNCLTDELTLMTASENKEKFPNYDTILDKDYQLIDNERLDFVL